MAKRRVYKRKGGKRVRKRKSSKFSKAIQSLRRMKPNQRSKAIRHSNDKFIRDIVSHVKKLRTKKLTGKALKAVQQHSAKLRMISSPKVSLQKKRTVLSQKGGIAPIFALLAPIAGALIGRMIRGRRG